VGYVVGEAKPYAATVLSYKPLRVGEYLYMEYYDYAVIATVSSSVTGSSIIGEGIVDPRDVERLTKFVRGGERVYYHRGSVRILGQPVNGRLYIPPVPPPPGTEVFKAPRKLLSEIFSPSADRVRIGTLLHELSVEVRVDINKVVSKHLAILAMTGMGKSNLVALLAKRVGEIGGTTVIFDYHGEYTSMKLKTPPVIVHETKLNPYRLSLEELSLLLGIKRNATRQKLALYECLHNGGDRRSGDFFQSLKKCLNAKTARLGEPAQKVLENLVAYESLLKKVLDEKAPDVGDAVVLGAINVVDLSELNSQQADAVVAHWLRRLLELRKLYTWSGGSRGLQHPVLVFIEEAHVFIPADGDTSTNQAAESIAREGRKFGVGLVVVSQRPRGLNPSILSQIGNLAVLRIVHPEDQLYIAKHCEPATQDLVEQLPGLNIGEAIVAGDWIPVPSLVKIDRVEEKISGGDVDSVSAWRSFKA